MSRTKLISMRVPARLLREVDRLAHEESRTRSDVTVGALRRWCREAQQRRVNAGLAGSLDEGADRAAWDF